MIIVNYDTGLERTDRSGLLSDSSTAALPFPQRTESGEVAAALHGVEIIAPCGYLLALRLWLQNISHFRYMIRQRVQIAWLTRDSGLREELLDRFCADSFCTVISKTQSNYVEISPGAWVGDRVGIARDATARHRPMSNGRGAMFVSRYSDNGEALANQVLSAVRYISVCCHESFSPLNWGATLPATRRSASLEFPVNARPKRFGLALTPRLPDVLITPPSVEEDYRSIQALRMLIWPGASCRNPTLWQCSHSQSITVNYLSLS